MVEGGGDRRTDDTWNAIFINGQKIGIVFPLFNIYGQMIFYVMCQTWGCRWNVLGYVNVDK